MIYNIIYNIIYDIIYNIIFNIIYDIIYDIIYKIRYDIIYYMIYYIILYYIYNIKFAGTKAIWTQVWNPLLEFMIQCLYYWKLICIWLKTPYIYTYMYIYIYIYTYIYTYIHIYIRRIDHVSFLILRWTIDLAIAADLRGMAVGSCSVCWRTATPSRWNRLWRCYWLRPAVAAI